MHTFALKPKATQQATTAKSTIHGRGHFWQSPEVRSILHLQRTIGNQAVHRMLQTDAENPELTGPASPCCGHDFSRIPIHPPAAGVIQTKLTINKPEDEYEQEADRVSEQVMRRPEPQLQPACPSCPKSHKEQPGREHESLQTKRVQASNTGQIAAPLTVHEVLRSPGQPLDRATRAFMEPRFGYDFSRVRVHTGAAAEQSAQAVNATAYTVGYDMVFGAGQFAPASQVGRRLLAHELTHVTQQNVPGPGGETSVRQLQREPMDPRHARGHGGEQSMGFGYSQEKGWILIEGPSGAGGHGVTTKGFDGVAYNPKANELHVIDNKSLKAGTAYSATAITKNLGKNLDTLIAKVQGMKDMPDQARILQHLTQMRNAIATGNNIPANTKLIVTGESGQATRVGGSLIKQGVEFREPGTTGPSPPRTSAPTPPGKEEASNKPMRKPPGGGPRTTVTATAKTVTSHKASTPEITTSKEPPNLGTPEYSATPDTPPAPTKTQTPAKKAPAKPKVPVQTKTPAVPSTATPDVTPKPPSPPVAAKTATPAAAGDKPTKTPGATRPTEPSATRKPTTPRTKTGGGGQAASAAAGAAQQAYSALAGRFTSQLSRVVTSKDPEMGAAIADMNRLLDAQAFLQNPKRYSANFLASYMINGAFGKFARQLAETEAQFFSTYPDVRNFSQQHLGHGMNLKALQERYEETSRNLRIPDARKALVTVFLTLDLNENSSKEEIDRRIGLINQYLSRQPQIGTYVKEFDKAKANYAFGLAMVRAKIDNLQQQLGELPGDFADNIRRRGDALFSAAKILEAFYDQVFPLNALPGASSMLYMLLQLSEGFAALGRGLHQFAYRAGGRQAEYKQEIARLETVADRLSKVRGAFDVIYPKTGR